MVNVIMNIRGTSWCFLFCPLQARMFLVSEYEQEFIESQDGAIALSCGSVLHARI